MQPPKDIYELLDKLREKPVLYLGSAHTDLLGRLMAFRVGLLCSPVRYDDGNPPYRHFDFWFALRFWGKPNNLPWKTLEDTLGSEGGWHKLWELLDEYRKCNIEDVATLVVKPHHKQRTLDGGGCLLGNPVPVRRFIIRQFIPSTICQIVWNFDGTRPDREVSYEASLEDALASVESLIGANRSEWEITNHDS